MKKLDEKWGKWPQVLWLAAIPFVIAVWIAVHPSWENWLSSWSA